MDEEHVLGLLLQLSKETSRRLLKDLGEVPPYSLKLVGDAVEPRAFFPRELNPTAKWPALFDAAVDSLRIDEAEGEVIGVAACAGLLSDGGPELAFGAQLETTNVSMFVFFRYRQEDGSWLVDDAQFLDELLVAGGLRWDPATRERLSRR